MTGRSSRQPPAARAMKPVRAAFEAPMRLTMLKEWGA